MPRRVDKNQSVIVKAFRDKGASVKITSMLGKGFPDILVGYRGKNYLIEIKTDCGYLTPPQCNFFDKWKGHLCIIRSVEEAMDFINSVPKD